MPWRWLKPFSLMSVVLRLGAERIVLLEEGRRALGLRSYKRRTYLVRIVKVGVFDAVGRCNVPRSQAALYSIRPDARESALVRTASRATKNAEESIPNTMRLIVRTQNYSARNLHNRCISYKLQPTSSIPQHITNMRPPPKFHAQPPTSSISIHNPIHLSCTILPHLPNHPRPFTTSQGLRANSRCSKIDQSEHMREFL